MSSTMFSARRALAGITGMLAVAAAAQPAGAQRARPRYTPPAQPPSSIPYTPYPGASVTIDPRWEAAQREQQRREEHRGQRGGGQTIVLVAVPGYYTPVMYDMYGRPVQPVLDPVYAPAPATQPLVGQAPYPTSGGYPGPTSFQGYTPDFSGMPYVVLSGGDMLVALPSGEQRRVPSCAAESAAKDPAGRPRTVFYSGAADGVVLHEGQRGRVQGSAPASGSACYGLDSFGRISLGQ